MDDSGETVQAFVPSERALHAKIIRPQSARYARHALESLDYESETQSPSASYALQDSQSVPDLPGLLGGSLEWGAEVPAGQTIRKRRTPPGMYTFPSSTIDDAQIVAYQVLQEQGLRLEKRTPRAMLYCGEPGVLPKGAPSIISEYCEALANLLGPENFTFQVHVHFLSKLSVLASATSSGSAAEDGTYSSPAFVRGVGARDAAERDYKDIVVILARSTEEAKIGIAALVGGGGFLHSAACTFPLLGYGVHGLVMGALRLLLPPELGEGEPFPFEQSEQNQQRKLTALGLLEECSNLEKVVWMQRGVALTQEIGAGVLRYISQKFGDQSMVRLLLLHVDPVRSSIVASPPPRTAADKALARSYSHFNESTPSRKLRALYQEMLNISKIALGTPFLQVWLQWVHAHTAVVKNAWATWDSEGKLAEIAQSEESEKLRGLKSKQQAEEKAPTQQGDAERASADLVAVKPELPPPEFNWPQDLGAIIKYGVDEGRITLADIHRLRNRLQGDLKAMCKGEVLANPTWQPLTSRDEEGVSNMSKLTGTLRTIYRVITSLRRASAPVVPAASPAKSASATPLFADSADSRLAARPESMPHPKGHGPHRAASLWRAKSRGYRSTPPKVSGARARLNAGTQQGGTAANGVDSGGYGGLLDLQTGWTGRSSDASISPMDPLPEEASLMETARVWRWAWEQLMGEAAYPRRTRLSAFGYVGWLAWVGAWSASEALLLEYIYHLAAEVEEATCTSGACEDDGWDAASWVHLAGACGLLVVGLLLNVQASFFLKVNSDSLLLSQTIKAQVLDWISKSKLEDVEDAVDLASLDRDLVILQSCVSRAHDILLCAVQLVCIIAVLLWLNPLVAAILLFQMLPILAYFIWQRNAQSALCVQVSSKSLRDQEAVLEVALREQSKFQSLNKMLGTEREASERTLSQLDQTKQVRLELILSQGRSARIAHFLQSVCIWLLVVGIAVTVGYSLVDVFGAIAFFFLSVSAVNLVIKMVTTLDHFRRAGAPHFRLQRAQRLLKPSTSDTQSDDKSQGVGDEGDVFLADYNAGVGTQPIRALWMGLGYPDAPDRARHGDVVLNQVSAVRKSHLLKAHIETFVLHKVSMVFPQGCFVGVVGGAKAGKSTLMRILAGQEERCSGEISFGGVQFGSRVKDRVAVMHAEPVLFDETIIYNITVGRAYPSEQVEAAMRQACLIDDEFVVAQGMEFQVGTNGIHLPAYLRQRVGIARTVLLQRQYVFFDEPTSLQGSDTIVSIGKNLRSGGCWYRAPGAQDDREWVASTVIAFTQTPLFVQSWDIAYVLENGRVAEYGDPKSLRKNGAHFSQMCRRQAGLMTSGVQLTPSFHGGVSLSLSRKKSFDDIQPLSTAAPVISVANVKRLWPFSSLCDEHCEVVAKLFHNIVISEGGILYEQGQPIDSLFVIVSGSFVETFDPRPTQNQQSFVAKAKKIPVKTVSRKGCPGNDAVETDVNRLRYLLPGDVVGEESALADSEEESMWLNTETGDDGRGPAHHCTFLGTATARCEARAVVLDREALLAVLRLYPELRAAIVAQSRAVRRVRSGSGLERVWTLQGCSRPHAQILADHMQLRCYDRGDVIFSLPHGHECTSLYMVVQGSVKMRHLVVKENDLVVSPGSSGAEIVSLLLPGQYFGETAMTTWIRGHSHDSSAYAASTNPSPFSTSALSSQATHPQRDPMAGRLLRAQSAQDGTVVAVFSQAQLFLVGKMLPEVEAAMHSVVRNNMQTHAACVEGALLAKSPYFAETPAAILRRLGQSMDFTSHPPDTLLMQRVEGGFALDHLILVLKGTVRVVFKDPCGLVITTEMKDGSVINGEALLPHCQTKGMDLLMVLTVTTVLVATHSCKAAKNVVNFYRSPEDIRRIEGVGFLLMQILTIKGIKSLGFGHLPDSQLAALLVSCTTHLLTPKEPLVCMKAEAGPSLPVITTSNLTKFICIVLQGSVRVWTGNARDGDDPGLLVVSGGVFVSQDVLTKTKPGPFWRMFTPNVCKAIVEEDGATVAVIDVLTASKLNEVEWVIEQGVVARENAVRGDLASYVRKLQSYIGRVRLSLGWLPEMEARVLAARSRWGRATRSVKQLVINGTTHRTLFGKMPTALGNLEAAIHLDVLPLEEVLQDLRDTAIRHQVDISAMVKKWHSLEPMPSDPHQPPATVDVQNLSAGYMASLVAKIDDVKQSRRTRFVQGMVAVQALWARGLSGAGNWHENRMARQGQNWSSSNQDPGPRNRRAELEALMNEHTLLPIHFEKLKKEHAALRAALRTDIMENMNKIKDLYTELKIVSYSDLMEDRRRLEHPHEDILDELQEEVRRLEFAKKCVAPLQEAAQGVIERNAARTVTQVHTAKAQGAYETILQEKYALLDELEMPENQLQLIVKPDTEPWTGAAHATKDEKAVISAQQEVLELRKLIQQRHLDRSRLRDKVNTLAVQVGEPAEYVERVMLECGDVSEGAMDALSREVASLENKKAKLEDQKEELFKQIRSQWDSMIVAADDREEFEHCVLETPALLQKCALLQEESARVRRLAAQMDERALLMRKFVATYKTGKPGAEDAIQILHAASKKIQALFRGFRIRKVYQNLRDALHSIRELYNGDHLDQPPSAYAAFYSSMLSSTRERNLYRMLQMARVRKQELEVQVVFIIAAEFARGQESLRMTSQECDDVFRGVGHLIASQKENHSLDLARAITYLENEMQRFVTRNSYFDVDDDAQSSQSRRSKASRKLRHKKKSVRKGFKDMGSMKSMSSRFRDGGSDKSMASRFLGGGSSKSLAISERSR